MQNKSLTFAGRQCGVIWEGVGVDLPVNVITVIVTFKKLSIFVNSTNFFPCYCLIVLLNGTKGNYL
jgi:hypothetical protein